MPASDHMLRGRSPWGLGGAVYLLVRSFVCIRSCVDVRGRRYFLLGFGDVIECRASMLDRTGALGRRTVWLNCKGPTVVVFEISPSENFSPPPTTLTTTTRSYRTLCDVSALALSLNFEDQVRSRHHVQVQSPFSTA